MIVRSVRLKLTLLYAGTVAVLLAVFICADMVGLRRNLMAQVAGNALSPAAMHEAWLRAILEHVALAGGLAFVVFVFGYVFIRRALKPVRDMARTARAISEENLSLRVDAGGDRTEIGELASTLNDMIGRLEASFERTRRFSADAAHELSTPLTTLRGEVEIALRRERSGEEYREALSRLLAQVIRVSSIVDNLLFLSRRDAGDPLPVDGSVFLDDVVVASTEDFHSLAEERGVGLRLGRIDRARVRGSAQMMRLMFDNLLGNAIKFTQKGGEVAVGLEVDGERFRATIADTGVGIPPEDLSHVFERFYRVEKSRAKTTGGVGLGLSIVREVAGVHGVDVHIDSTPGAGTTVAVTGRTSAAGDEH
jgi:heavy metal sensor kinase